MDSVSDGLLVLMMLSSNRTWCTRIKFVQPYGICKRVVNIVFGPGCISVLRRLVDFLLRVNRW